MKKLLILLVVITLAAGGFYWYINSGKVLDEAAPEIMAERMVKIVDKDEVIDTEEIEEVKEIEEIKEVEEVEEMKEVKAPITSVIRKGAFTAIDAIHKGSGKAMLYPNTTSGPTLRLEDFSVTRGPDLYVYLSKNSNISSSSELGEFYSLGTLKSSKGNQNYSLPDNHEEYSSVVIWCKSFGVLFSSATLAP